MRKKFLFIVCASFIFFLFLGIFLFNFKKLQKPQIQIPEKYYLEIRSIDTMKYSRDLAREKLSDTSFDKVIDKQLADIASAGANYVAIDTPYDPEFLPFLQRWVNAARKHKLKIWFRGNFSGWERWFDYPSIDMNAHIKNTRDFILNNENLFMDGDIFTPCPECENGVDMGENIYKHLKEYRKFLIDEAKAAQDVFASLRKNVKAGYFSMNADIASAVMDKDTTKKLGGIVVIDHYVNSPSKLASDIRDLAENCGGKIVLGEFGAPIPEIHGHMTEQQQSKWVADALAEISTIKELIGINYWVNEGGSTALWNDDGSARKAVGIIRNFYFDKSKKK